MNNYYFTYGLGSKTQPFKGGYSLVKANTVNEAINKHTDKYGTNAGFVRCAFWFTEKEFLETYPDRLNCGEGCHETIE